MNPPTTTNNGLHEFVYERVLSRYVRSGHRAADLGSGPGRMAAYLRTLGCDVLAVDRDPRNFEPVVPHRNVDLDCANFAGELGPAAFHVVTAIEVIEHLENPIGFLRNVGLLLAPGGVGVITTPNVDSLPARIKFLITGKIRAMDEHSEPTHISPIFCDLFKRQFLGRAGLALKEHLLFPPTGYQLTRPRFARGLAYISAALRSPTLLGDNHVFVLGSLQ